MQTQVRSRKRINATPAHLEAAHRIFWVAYWHTTHTFDGFFSPQHLFIYRQYLSYPAG